MRPKTNFEIGLRNALLEPKHYHAMGDALWLFTYLVDRQGKQVDKSGFGKVARGVPIRDEDIARALGSSRRTVIRWREVLVRHGYIMARRTPYGHVYAIAKPKKWKEKSPDSPQRDVTQTVHLSHPSDVQVPVHLSGRDVQVPVKRCAGTCTNKEETQETQERETAKELTPDFISEMERKIWGYYIELVEPGPVYSLTIKRKRMLRDRHAEMVAVGQTPNEALLHLGEAVSAFSEDDYHMGRKKGYEGAGRKGFEEIFRTQEIFEGWCSKYSGGE